MADPQYASIPQTFTFRGRELKGYLLGFTGNRKRRFVMHDFPKRKAGRVEDMEQGSQRIEVRLVFLGDTCARDAKNFFDFVESDPFGLLVHPTAGRWQAFCEGPQEDVDLGRATDEIDVRVAFVETEDESSIAKETPDVATAAQEVTAQKTSMETAVGTFMAQLAKAETAPARALSTLDTALGQLDVVEAPVDFMRDTVVSVSTAQSTVVGKVLSIQTKANLLSQDIQNLADATTDLFAGGEVAAATAENVTTLIGTVQQHAEELSDELIADAVTPAGAAEAVGAIDEATASCLALSDALAAARPPTIEYIVPSLTDVIDLAQLLRSESASARTVLAFVTDILSLNRIPNPAAIPPGTVLLVPLG
jgi:prophage DNA circulation protein